MKHWLTRSIGLLGLSLALLFGSTLLAQTAPTKETKAAKTTASQTAATPTNQEIADAKAKGEVWVNTSSKVYHKETSKFYGKTKRGKFMTEEDAKKAGYHEAKNEASAATKSKSAATKK